MCNCPKRDIHVGEYFSTNSSCNASKLEAKMGVWEKQLPLTSTIHEQSMIAVANQSLKRALIDRIMTNFVTILSLRRDRLHSRIAVKVKQTGGRRTPAIQNRSTQR